jgi:hypothetical protein
MGKRAQSSRQTLFFIFDRYSDNETLPEARGMASRRQKESYNPSTDRVVKHQDSWLSRNCARWHYVKIG